MDDQAETLRPHVPRVEIVTQPPDDKGITSNLFTRVLVDGVFWAATGYEIHGTKVDEIQSVTLTFLADVTVEHPKP